MRIATVSILLALLTAVVACGESTTPVSSTSLGNATPTTATAVRIVFLGSTTRRTDLPASAADCVSGVGATHIHPSWRAFAAIPLTPAPPDRYLLTFDDVPVNTPVSFRINDQNWCDVNPTGAVTRDVFANDVRLFVNTTTPGNGDEPGFQFTISSSGLITQ